MSARITYIGDAGKEYPLRYSYHRNKDAFAALRDDALLELEREYGPGPVIVAVRVDLDGPHQLRDIHPHRLERNPL